LAGGPEVLGVSRKAGVCAATLQALEKEVVAGRPSRKPCAGAADSFLNYSSAWRSRAAATNDLYGVLLERHGSTAPGTFREALRTQLLGPAARPRCSAFCCWGRSSGMSLPVSKHVSRVACLSAPAHSLLFFLGDIVEIRFPWRFWSWLPVQCCWPAPHYGGCAVARVSVNESCWVCLFFGRILRTLWARAFRRQLRRFLRRRVPLDVVLRLVRDNFSGRRFLQHWDVQRCRGKGVRAL